MSWNGFSSLNLADVEPDDYAPLPAGEHDVECTGGEIKTGSNGKDKRLVVSLNSVDGAGSIKTGFNLYHTGSKQAQEIGLRQLKAFLVASGHPNPDEPGDLGSLKGLRCRVYVGKGKPFIGQDGQQREPLEVKRFIIPGDAKTGTSSGSGGSSRRELNDEIPF